ncbi:MAG: hypothetical protein WCI48_12355 [Bacteroidota bacterium]|jgi:F0F1-type ATP synthase assembly protein I
MRSEISKYARRLLLLTFAAGIVSLALFFVLPHAWISPSLPFLFVFYYACSLISYILLDRSVQKRINRFISVFMLTTAVKLFLYLAVMIIYAFVNRKDAIPFLLNFFFLYLVYTVFEVIQIVSLTNPASSADEKRNSS